MNGEEWINQWRERAEKTGQVESSDTKIFIDATRNIT